MFLTRSHITLAYITLMLMVFALCSMFIAIDNSAHTNHRTLHDTLLPVLKDLKDYDSLSIQYERRNYQFTFIEKHNANAKQEILDELNEELAELLQRMLSNDATQSLAMELTPIYEQKIATAEALQEQIQKDQPNEALIHELMFQLTQLGNQQTPIIDKYIEAVSTEAIAQNQQSLKRSQMATKMLIGFCVILAITSLVVGILSRNYFHQIKLSRRLSLFVERNPNPVMSFDLNGRPTYFNPSAIKLFNELGIPLSEPERLLPDAFRAALIAFGNEPDNDHSKAIRFSRHGVSYDLAVQYIADVKIANLYLENITREIEAKERLNFQAKHDFLTELPNRRHLEESLMQYTQDSPPESFNLVLLNLNQFSRITALYGYQFGDGIIKQFADDLTQILSTHSDKIVDQLPYRIDGTTFAIISQPGDHCQTLVELVVDKFSSPLQHNGNCVHLYPKVGISNFPNDGITLQTLIDSADTALVQSKKSDVTIVQYYNSEIHKNELFLSQIEHDLRLSMRELTLYFQPKINATSGEICGCEALMRWPRSDGFAYFPDQFIPVAEQCGLIFELGKMAIDLAVETVIQLKPIKPFKMAINLSAQQFEHPQFIQCVREAIAPHPGVAKLIEFEITESLLVQNIKNGIGILHELRNMGFTISLDDFGTGYSSLGYLKTLPLDKLKIDRSFIAHITDSSIDHTLVEGIIKLAHSLNLIVVAEGVETQYQFELLKSMRCEEIQGYYFSRPIPADKLMEKYFSS